MSAPPKVSRCAIYTRKSTEHNLDFEFNSLDAQREACEAHIKSQLHEGWRLLSQRYDDGGISGVTLERPDLQRLLADPELRRRMGQAGRERALRHFVEERMTSETEKLYEDLLAVR